MKTLHCSSRVPNSKPSEAETDCHSQCAHWLRNDRDGDWRKGHGLSAKRRAKGDHKGRPYTRGEL